MNRPVKTYAMKVELTPDMEENIEFLLEYFEGELDKRLRSKGYRRIGKIKLAPLKMRGEYVLRAEAYFVGKKKAFELDPLVNS